MGGGGIEQHVTLVWPPNSSVGSGGEFLRGYIDKLINMATTYGVGKYDFLPDTISIHGYWGKWSPEGQGYTDLNGYNRNEWFTRLQELHDICDEYGYLPNFVLTEYGWALPSENSTWTPTNMTETGHALYSLRFSLINATMRPYEGIGWEFCTRFSHNKGNSPADFGFHNDDAGDSGFGSYRSAKYVARALFDPTVTLSKRLMLDDPDNKVWVSLNHEAPTIQYPGYVWCGWETENAKWGAIWQYERSDIYQSISSADKVFKAPISYSNLNVAARYRFTFSAGNASLDEITQGTVTKDTISDPNNVLFTIPNVTENPIFLRFQ